MLFSHGPTTPAFQMMAVQLVWIGSRPEDRPFLEREIFALNTPDGYSIELGVPMKVAEIVEMGKKTAALGEELGFTAKEMGQLQKVGELETTVTNVLEHLSPPMRESCNLYESAQAFLKSYKGFISESQARELIHQTGIKTFPRPQGIPENFRVKISDKGAGMKYVHPTDEGTYIRVMPGTPHSKYPHQQRPYVSHVKNGSYLDKNGNVVNSKDPAAHIPLDEFMYGD